MTGRSQRNWCCQRESGELDMKIVLNRYKAIRAIIMIAIVAFVAFSDYAYPVYAIKVITIVTLLFNRRRIRVNFYLGWMCLFLAFSALSILWAPNKGDAVFYTVWALQAMALALSIQNTIDSEEDIEYVLKCFLIAGMLLLVRVISRTSIRELGSFRLGTNMRMNANELSMKASVACIAAYYFSRKEGESARTRTLYVVMLILLLLLVLFTGSRKGSVMTISSIVLYTLFKAKTPMRFLRNILIAMAFTIGFYFLITRVEILYNALGHRLLLLLNMFDADAYVGNSISNRKNFIEVGIQLFFDNPLGYGMGGFQTVSGLNIYSHNNYIELLVDVGVFGFMIYYSMYIFNLACLIKKIRKKNNVISIMLALTLVIIVLEYGFVTFQSEFVQIIISIVYASIYLAKRTREHTGVSSEVIAE